MPVVRSSVQPGLDRLDAWEVVGNQLLCVPLRDLSRHFGAWIRNRNAGHDVLHLFYVRLLFSLWEFCCCITAFFIFIKIGGVVVDAHPYT